MPFLMLLSVHINSLIIKLSIVILLFLLIKNPSNYLSMLFVTLSFGVFYLPFNIIAGNVLLVFFFFSMVYYGLIEKYAALDKRILVLSIIMALLVLIITLNSTTKSVFSGFSIITSMILVFLFSYYKDANITHTIKMIILFCGILILYNFLMYKAGNLYLFDNRYSFNEGMNANTYAQALALFSMSTIFGLVFFKQRLFKLFCLCAALIGIYMVLKAGSRTSFLGVLIFILITCYLCMKNKSFIIKILFFLVLLAGLVFAFQYFDIMKFFGRRDLGDSGRFFIWRIMINEIIPQNLLLGIGFDVNDTRFWLSRYGSVNSYAHNIVLATLGAGGIFFFGAMLYLVLYSIKKGVDAYRNNKIYSFPLIILLSLLTMGLTEDMVFEKSFWFILGLCLFFYNSSKKKIYFGS